MVYVMAADPGYRIEHLHKNSGEETISQLAELQAELLPRSLVSLLGVCFARRFYRYCSRSEQESVLILLEGDRVLGACVLSFWPGTLDWRLLARTPMLIFALLRFYRLPLGALVRETVSRAGGGANTEHKSLPELVLIFVRPGLRGKGLGGRLMEECEALLRARSIDAYVVDTADDEGNRALDFYLAKGFQIVGKAMRHGIRYSVLRKDLGRSLPPAV